MRNKNISLIIGGDLVPTESNRELFEKAQIEELIGKELKEELEKVDFRIFNLEAPITKNNEKLLKCGPNLKINPKSIKGIKGLNPSLLGLANNHIMDFKEQGLYDTLNILENNNISYVGIGNNLSTLKKFHILEKDEIKIGIYVCAEREFSIATNTTAGVNPLELIDNLEDIQKLRKLCDYIVVLYHGGKEHYRYPSPMLKKICNKMIEYGASIVICQHSHCIGSYEEYKNGIIVYGQGNFIFDDEDNNEFWNTSLLVKVEINDGRISIKYIPIVKKKNKIRKANLKEEKEIVDSFEKRSLDIKNEGFIEEEYRKFSKEYIWNYLYSICGFPRILRRIDNKVLDKKVLKYIYKNKIVNILNFIECEAHRELFIEGLKSIMDNKRLSISERKE